MAASGALHAATPIGREIHGNRSRGRGRAIDPSDGARPSAATADLLAGVTPPSTQAERVGLRAARGHAEAPQSAERTARMRHRTRITAIHRAVQSTVDAGVIASRPAP
jgi:hypothetical protein